MLAETITNRVGSRPGRGAAWLARLTGGQKVAGSNPVAPTSKAVTRKRVAAFLDWVEKWPGKDGATFSERGFANWADS